MIKETAWIRRAFLGVVIAFSLGCGSGCGSQQGESAAHPEPVVAPAPDPIVSDPGEAATEATIVVGTDACNTDADCVPSGCCHPTACGSRAHQPACGDAVCTSECRYGTLDCGGACLCQGGLCAARLSVPPVIEGMDEVH